MNQPPGSAQRQFGAVASAYATSAVHASGPYFQALVAAAALTERSEFWTLVAGRDTSRWRWRRMRRPLPPST